MNKFKGFKLGKGKADIRKIGAAVVATMLVVAMVIGLVPNDVAEVLAADKTTNIEGFSATMIADPDTSEDDHIFNGTPAEDGKIWTDKSVTTGAIYGVTSEEDNFYVALSALAQTYNTVETGLSAEQKNIAYDVVFVLDFSGSMNDSNRAKSMVNALNPAMVTLMNNNNNRIAVVGYSGSNVSTSSATTLLKLDHYGTTKQVNGEYVYFEYTSNEYIRTVAGVTDGSGKEIETASKRVNGGTPTQRGIYRGMDVLQSTAKPNDNITRIPILVLLTDGAAGCAVSDYDGLTGTPLQGSAHPGSNGKESNDDKIGAYTVLTANYAKSTINTVYRERYDYTGIFGADETVAKFYTIGLDITKNSWTHFVLDPGITTATGTKVSSMQSMLAADSTYGSNYDYADNSYVDKMTEDDLKNAFTEIVNSLQVQPQITTSINDPVTKETSSSATGTNVVFTDYLGYKMELKGDSQYLRYGGVNYRFDKQSDNSYKFSGYDQDGNAVTGPVITKNDVTYTLQDVIFKVERVDETYNDQTGYWKVTWSFPSAILPTYSRINDYDNTDLDSIRMLYEVGLEENADLQNDSLKIDEDGNLVSISGKDVDQYVFHTNLYDYKTPKAMTWSEYTPAKDNPFYYETGYTTDSKVAGTTEPYIRLDMTASSAQLTKLEGTANIELTNINVSLSNSRATFVYNGTTYRADLTGDRDDEAIWSGEVSIPVTAKTADGTEISVKVAVRIEAEYDEAFGFWESDTLTLSGATIHGERATLSGTTATLSGLKVSAWGEVSTDTVEEIVSVYMKLEGNDTDGYYVVDKNNNKIAIAKVDDNNYVVVLGDKTYYSTLYYKYADGTKSYVEKELAKGTIAKSVAGYLEVVQPKDKDFELTDETMKTTFIYHAADGNPYTATGITFSDGSTSLGKVGDPNANTPPKGTFKVCVDGIKNGLTDVNGKQMVVHFDFIVEPQTLEDGKVRYVVLDCSYWESEDQYAVDVIVADMPEIDETTGNYKYAVSYTIESTHASGDANVTQTDPHFFHSHLEDDGQMKARLGNNGRLAVDVSTAYEKDIIVEKEWYDRLGNKIATNSEALNGVSITAGLYQTYSYTNDKNEVVSSGEEGILFATAELNQSNGFTYTWEKGTLPKYLVDANGAYRLDGNKNRVPIVYKVVEETGADGWTLSEIEKRSTETADTFTLQNVPLTEFSPSVEKSWSNKNGAPAGYKVKIELLANGNPVTVANKIDAEHEIVAELEQENTNSDATLRVTFGGEAGEDSPQTIQLADFSDTTSKEYTFTYKGKDGNGFGGQTGSGTHAEYATVTITISRSAGEKLSIVNAIVSYHYIVIGTEDEWAKETLGTFRSQFVEEGNTKTAKFLMSYKTTYENVEVILDGDVDAEETKAWYNKLDKWNLPMLDKDENGNYAAIVYTIRETLLVPYEEGMVVDETKLVKIGDSEYVPCASDKNGLIKVPQTDGTEKVLYKSVVTHTGDYQFKVANAENVTSVTAQKVWVDNNNKYNTRPASITFELWADNVKKDEKVIDPENQDKIWDGTANVEWKDIPLYNDATGEEIVYTVKEVINDKDLTASDKYKTEVTPDAEKKNHFIVKNSLHADPAINYTSMAVEKEWIDDNNAAGTRPENIYMVLYRKADGTNVEELVPGASVVILNEDNEWKDDETWTELAKYNEEGKKYIYSVKEYESLTARNTEGVSGYTDVSPSTDKTETSYKFTNKLDGGVVSKTVTKEWKDAALDSSKRPNVTVVLSGKTTDGESVDLSAYAPTQELSESSSWSYTWDSLPEYAGGMKIDYTITETKIGNDDVVNGGAGNYKVSVQDDGDGNNFIVTNTLTGTTTITVEKKWENVPEGYDIPDVTFDVYNRIDGRVEVDGKPVTLTVTKDELSATSVELPKYNASGDTIYYYLEEEAISGDGSYKINSAVNENTGENGSFYYVVVNTYVSLKQDIEGTKTWVGVKGDNIPTDITLELSRKVGDGDAQVVTATPTWSKPKDGETWMYKYEGLPIYENNDESKPYTYSVKETSIKLKQDSEPIDVIYNENDATKGTAGDYEVTVDGFNITNKLVGTVDGADLDGTKTWVNITEEKNVPDSIKVELWRKVTEGTPEKAKDTSNQEVAAITVLKEGQTDKMAWAYDFTGVTLPKYDANGNAYEYFVKEIKVTAGDDTETASYTDSTTGTVGDYDIELNGLNIKNTLKIGNDKDYTTELPFTKLWRKADGTKLTTNLPESITVQLLQDGSALNPDETKTLKIANADASDASKWTGKFENLRTYKDNGISKYKYTVSETKVETVNVDQTTKQAGAYTVSINAAGNEITNALSDAKTDISIKKTWKGVAGDNIPSIKVQLLQSGTVVKEETLSKDTTNLVVDGNTWTYTFKDLPVYQANGIIQHVYTVKEVEIAGKQVDETTGKAGDYESKVEVDSTNSQKFNITNTLTGTVDKIEGHKIWKDIAKESERPEEITVALLRKIQGGTSIEIATQKVSGTDWKFVFTKDSQGNALNKYDPDGNKYIYSVAEKDLQGNLVEEGKSVTYNNNQYKVSYGESNYTITNTLFGEYNPKYNPIKVTKIWKDDGNSQNERPSTLKVTLSRQGEPLETTPSVELSADNAVNGNASIWSAAFTGEYPMYDGEGRLYVYDVEEENIPNYTLQEKTTEAKGTAAKGFTLTNVYTPGAMTITVKKEWVDNNNALKTRPETLTLNLYQNGEPYKVNGIAQTVVLKADENDTWTTTLNVPATDENGKLYTYTVKEPEDALKGTDYVKTSETGLTVTNTLQAEVHVQGTKTWKNIDKEYRPESITVELWRKTTEGTEVQMTDVDGKVISVITDAKKEWKYDFGNFAKYDEKGALYTYIVKETKIGNTPIEQSDYTVSNGEGYDLINKLKDVKITISGKKTWVDNNNQYKMRPESITVNLLRDGVKVASVQVKAAADGTWTYEFKDLPKYNMDNGKLYAYSVEEAAVENYKSSVNGYDITNTLDETKIPTPSAPKTSDSRTAAGYALTTIIALAAVATAFFKRKRIVK